MGDSVSTEVLARLDEGLFVLTGNDRSARAVRLAWDRQQALRGHKSWEPAHVLSWHHWTQLLWKALLLDGRAAALLLSPLQEAVIWRRVIEARISAGAPSSTKALVDLAATTWQRLCAYQGGQRLERAIPYLHGDSLEFALWARSFSEICAQESLLSESLLEAELRLHLAKNDMDSWSPTILLLGFDRLTPAQELLVHHCRSLGSVIEFAKVTTPGVGTLVAASDEREEIQGCARWIREQVIQTPGTRIALIVTDLEHEMSTIDSVLREVLSPESDSITADSAPVPYEFSLGRPLSHEAMVQCALNLLRWVSKPLGLQHVSQLLLSPYFAGAAHEAFARAEFDSSKLRHELRLRPEMTIKSFLGELQRSSFAQSRLSSFRRIVESIEYAQVHSDLRARGFGDWAEWIRGWLTRAQWGATDLPFSSREYQVRERWEGALDAFATLDFLGEEIDFEHAFETLDRLVRDVIFAPQSRDAPVQVLGPLEAAGERFDAIWVLRTGEFNWPPGLNSLALLPRSLQRDLGMPGVDAEREREAARQLTHRLAGSGVNVVFSYAQAIPEGGHQRVSAVVRDLHFRDAEMMQITGPEAPRFPIELDRFQDDTPVPALSAIKHRGGVRVLELQAACGFRAFAEMRLGSSEPRERDAGFTALERGNIVHAALEEFWRSVGSQRDLISLGQNKRDEAVRRAVSHSLGEARRREADAWDASYLEAQHIRLTKLLDDWLSIEVERPEFTVIAQERRQRVSIGPLDLSLRVDRVDLVDGHQVIIDYKTGEASTSEWLTDRPDKPQVPLYAILSTEAPAQDVAPPYPLGAVGFAQVRSGNDMQLRGFEAAPGVLTAIGSRAKPAKMEAESLQAQVVRWREVLEQLANDFANGDTRVRPKRYPTTCERCGQRLLCRVDASLFETNLEEMAEDDKNSHG